MQLLVRSSRGASLTEVGHAFVEDARASLDHSERAARRARRAATGEEGRVRVGFVGSAIHDVLTGVMVPFSERFPDVSLVPRKMNTVPQVEALRSGHLDVGFLRLPSDHPLAGGARRSGRPWRLAWSAHPRS